MYLNYNFGVSFHYKIVKFAHTYVIFTLSYGLLGKLNKLR